MGRTPKKGLDYAPWDVDVFLGVREIDKLMESQGCTGFVIYFYLCQMAAKFEGYYYKWSYDDAATTAKRVGGGAGSEAVKQTVALCLQMGLFDKRLFDRYGILTSRRIQRNYVEAKARQRETTVIEEYWLLEKNYSPGGSDKCSLLFVSCCDNPDSCDNNPDSCGNNSAERRGKKSKGKKSKDDDNKTGGASDLSSSSSSSSALAFFSAYVSGNPTQYALNEFAEFERELGQDICARAGEIAQANNEPKWPYIRGILNNVRDAGYRTLAEWDAGERERQRRRNETKGGYQNSGMPYYARGTRMNQDGTWEYDPGDTSGSL